jgi:hypothetical protein
LSLNVRQQELGKMGKSGNVEDRILTELGYTRERFEALRGQRDADYEVRTTHFPKSSPTAAAIIRYCLSK